jgi:hypothetical protein
MINTAPPIWKVQTAILKKNDTTKREDIPGMMIKLGKEICMKIHLLLKAFSLTSRKSTFMSDQRFHLMKKKMGYAWQGLCEIGDDALNDGI